MLVRGETDDVFDWIIAFLRGIYRLQQRPRRSFGIYSERNVCIDMSC